MKKSPNEFWLFAHCLAEAYNAEGLTAEERAINLTDELLEMPPVVQRQSLTDLRMLRLYLDDLYPIVSAAVRISEEPRGERKGGAA